MQVLKEGGMGEVDGGLGEEESGTDRVHDEAYDQLFLKSS